MYTEEELADQEINRRIEEVCYLLSSLKDMFDDDEWNGVKNFKEFIRTKLYITQPVLRSLIMS